MQEIRKFALDVCSVDDGDVVKIAGIIRRVKNFWRAFQDPDYRDRALQLKNESEKYKELINSLSFNIEKLQKSIDDVDVDEYSNSLTNVRQLSFELAKETGQFRQMAEVAHSLAPTETKEIRHVTKEMMKDLSVKEQLTKQLPQGYDLAIGSAGIPVQQSNWMKQFSPDDVQFSITVADRIKSDLARMLPRYIDFGGGDAEQLARKMLDSVSQELLKNIATGLLNGHINKIDFSRVSEQIKNRPANQMKYYMSAYNVQIPGTDITFDMPVIVVVDLMASGIPTRRLSVYWATHLRMSAAQKQASRINELQKLAYANTHEWARNVLYKAFLRVMKREPTLAELQMVQAVAAAETNYGKGWKGAGVGSNNWGAIQCCKPKDGVCPPNSFLYEDTHPLPDGTNEKYQICFKSYATPEDGAADLIYHIFVKRRSAVLPAVASGSLWGFSEAMYNTGYYEGHGKTKEDRIAGHVKFLQRRLDQITKALGEEQQLSPQAAPQQQDQMLAEREKQQVEHEYQALMPALFASGPVEKLIVNSIIESKLPKTRVLVRLASNFYPANVRYAHALSSVLREEIGADLSIHSNSRTIELECDVLGQKESVLKAVKAICSGASDAFDMASGMVVKAYCYADLASDYDILSANESEECFRKFAFWMMNGKAS